MYISYSGYKKADCLWAYWLVYVAKIFSDTPEDRLGSIYGTVVGKVFEVFYRDSVWKKGPQTQSELEAKVVSLVDETLDEEQKPRKGRPGGVIVWADPETNPRGLYATREALIEDVLKTIPRGLETIRLHRLLSLDAVAELKLDTQVMGHTIAGRADFTMTRITHGDLAIVDGKGSRNGDRYLDPEQLLWYCLLYWRKFDKFPDWAGFLHWRKDPPYNIDYFTFDRDDAKALEDKILTLLAKISSLQDSLGPDPVPLSTAREAFKPSPSDDNCRFCPYATEEMCPQGFVAREKLTSKFKARSKS